MLHMLLFFASPASGSIDHVICHITYLTCAMLLYAENGDEEYFCKPELLMCRTTPGEWLMEANQKTDRPPEQIVREVSIELGVVTLELASAKLLASSLELASTELSPSLQNARHKARRIWDYQRSKHSALQHSTQGQVHSAFSNAALLILCLVDCKLHLSTCVSLI